MTTSDSGVIDLFAIHKEEEAKRVSVPPSAPPPAVTFDLRHDADMSGDVEGYALAQAQARRKTKILGGLVGAVAVIGILAGAIALGTAKDTPKPSAAAEPPPPALTAPPPVAEAPPPPAQPTPAPPTTAKTEKPDYTPASAAAAYAASQNQGKKKSGAFRVGRPIGGGVKLQKIQSSGVSN